VKPSYSILEELIRRGFVVNDPAGIARILVENPGRFEELREVVRAHTPSRVVNRPPEPK
jgi:hypothetical protein